MALTVQQLIETLYKFPPEAKVAFEEFEYDQKFFIVGFNSGDGKLTIVISSEEKEEETEEG